MSTVKKTFMIGGDLEVNRLGFGAMRLVGEGVWGEAKDPEKIGRASCRERVFKDV